MRKEKIKEIVSQAKGITSDSRKVEKGFVFVAYGGVETDGNKFIDRAVKKGASVVIGEVERELSIPYFKVDNGRIALAQLWSVRYDHPEKKMKLIGVTGTDGKTTTSSLIYQILRSSGRKVGLISTIAAKIGNREIDTGFHVTSPDPEIFFGLLAEMVKAGCEYAVIETTSHALAQDRYGETVFAIGVLTNLGRDHLEFHKTLKDYKEAKGKLFRRSRISVLNERCKEITFFDKVSRDKTVHYNSDEEIREVKSMSDGEGQTFELLLRDRWLPIETNLPGDYNRENILAACKVAGLLGVRRDGIIRGIKENIKLKGRFERVDNELGINIVVDFAHTRQGLKAVLSVVNEMKGEKEKVIVVFGCNGERDKSKRAPMGRAAIKLADRVILTTEDPRKEPVREIFERIEKGCISGGGVRNKTYFRQDNRKKAIKKAIKMAKKGDWVMLLGKGHEQSMNIGGVELEWDEVSVVEEVLAKLTSRTMLK